MAALLNIVFFNKCTRTIILGLVLCMLPCYSPAANPLIINEMNTRVSLISYADVYEDKTSFLTIKDLVSERFTHQFFSFRGNHDAIYYGDGVAILWVKFDILNGFTERREFILELSHSLLEKVELFAPDENNQYVLRPYITNGSSNRYLFSLGLGAGKQARYFLRLAAKEITNAKLTVSTPVAYSEYRSQQSLLINLFMGIFASLLVYCFGKSLLEKELSYIYFSLVLIGTGISAVANDVYSLNVFSEYMDLRPRLMNMGYFLAVVANISVLRLFLQPGQYSAYFDEIFKGLLVINGIGLILSLAINISVFYVVSSVSTVTGIFVIAALHSYARGFKEPLNYLLYRIPFLMVLLFLVITYLTDNMRNVNIYAVLLGGAVIDVISQAIFNNRKSKKLRKQKNQQALKDATRQAERNTKNKLLEKINHEIRTPISEILGMAELLYNTSLSMNQRDYVHAVQNSGENLLQLIDNILDISKLETGSLELEEIKFDPSTLVNECLEVCKNKIGNKKLELICDIHPEVPGWVKGDAMKLRQVVINLLNMCLRGSEQGEVIISVDYRDQDSSRVDFQIIATGIDVDLLDHEQILNGTSEKTKGELVDDSHLIGLVIAQQLVRLMGGLIGINKNHQRGVEYWFYLPLPRQELSVEADKDYGELLRGLQLLVVDDNKTCCQVLEQQAITWGMQVNTACSGKEALAILRTKAYIKENVDVVIVDHDMPGMNGLELSAKITEDESINNDILIVMLTGLGVVPSNTAARNAGIRRVLTKPVTGKVLKYILAEELGHVDMIQQKSSHTTTDNHEPAKIQEVNEYRVLVAEDNDVSKKIILSMLKKMKLNFKTVNNGLEAINALQAEEFDLVLMDCDMPEMDGVTATRKIRAWEHAEQKSAIPIIALTAHVMDEQKRINMNAGMDAHLSKPVMYKQLKDTIQKWLII